MAYGRRRTTRRRTSRSTVRRAYRYGSYRRHLGRRRYRSRRSRTSSKTIKLTLDGTWTSRNASGTYGAFRFNTTQIPGFMEYATVYSHFRIKKCMLTVSRARGTETGLDDNYLMVGSRPFAALVAPQRLSNSLQNPGGANLPPMLGTSVPNFAHAVMVPDQQEDALRQTRWQRVVTPNNTRPYVHLGFFPYTLVGTYGPSVAIANPAPTVGTPATNAVAYQRVWEARRWMPFTWAGGANGTYPITFFGPYMITETGAGTGELADQIQYNVTLTVYCQFKGQK
nr:MAG: putative capsid protein [Cressdnaviricota sp.]